MSIFAESLASLNCMDSVLLEHDAKSGFIFSSFGDNAEMGAGLDIAASNLATIN